MFIKGFIVGCMFTLVVGAYTINKKSKELAKELKDHKKVCGYRW